jgi:hypothetical protein
MGREEFAVTAVEKICEKLLGMEIPGEQTPREVDPA